MRLLIYGSKEFAVTVEELAIDCGHEVAGFVDDFSPGPRILGTLDAVRQTHPSSEFGIAIAVGYSQLAARWTAWQRVLAAGYNAPALVHPRAYVARTANIGQGTMLMAGALVDVRAKIGEIAVIWPGVCISHDCAVGENTFISPNATLCGYVEMGAHSFVGAGAAVVDHCVVPPSTHIKMLSRYIGKHA
jgi:sugar O-acyltransferase (sialic acid O-acetyltransferase NeuD family)